MLDELREIADQSFWYLASPYTKYPGGLTSAWEDVCRTAAWLTERQVPVFCPIAHSHPIAIHGNLDPTDHELWLSSDAPMMRAACGLLIVEMPGWMDSYGVGVEIEAFENMGKPIRQIPFPPKGNR